VVVAAVAVVVAVRVGVAAAVVVFAAAAVVVALVVYSASRMIGTQLMRIFMPIYQLGHKLYVILIQVQKQIPLNRYNMVKFTLEQP
jgi:hypothetical protein